MSNQAWVEPFLVTAEDSTALTNSTSATSILPSSRKFTLPSYFADAVGKTLNLKARGRISTVVTTPGTLTFEVRLGSVVAWSSGALSLNVVAKTNVSWNLDLDLTFRTLGAGTAANVLGIGTWCSEAVIGSPLPTVGGSGVLNVPVSAPAVGTGFDNTASQTLDLFATWSVANAANSITTHQFRILSLN